MKPRLLDLLVCPWCGQAFDAHSFDDPPCQDIEEGLLVCGKKHAFPIVRGIPRILKNAFAMFPDFVNRNCDRLPPMPDVPRAHRKREEVIQRTRDSFGYQWTFFSEMAIDFRANFLHYIHPLDQEFFPGKLGLDVGCGFGRHVYNAALFGAEMVAVDISDAIESTQQNTRALMIVHPVQADIYHLPFRSGVFDFAYSIGVLHHLPDPEGGFQRIVPFVKPGGAVFVWVYSKTRRWVNMMIGWARAVSTRLPRGCQQIIALGSAIVDWTFFIVPYRLVSSTPVFGRWTDRLMFPRLKVYSKYPFQVVWADWFDRLAAPVRFYYNQEDLTGWIEHASLEKGQISPTGLFGWRAYGQRPARVTVASQADGLVEVPKPAHTWRYRVPRRRRPVRVLALATNPEAGASTRFRVLQWRPLLEENGFNVDLDAFFSSRAAEVLYRPGHKLRISAHVVAGTLRRVASLARAATTADILFIHREAFPLGRKPFFNRIARFPGPIVYDYDDAMFLPQRQSRGMLSYLEKLETVKEVMSLSDIVLAGNAFLAEYARQFTDRVVVLPTCIDTVRFCPRPDDERTRQLTIGWIGSHSTAKYLHSLRPVFEQIAKRHRFKLYVIGSPEPMHLDGEEHAPWTLAREVDDFLSCDIGVYPLWDDAWAQGKCGFKAIQFMACGVPVVASAVGMNREIIEDGVNGFLTTSDAEWIEKLDLLLSDAALRWRIGKAGRSTILERYSLVANGPKLLAALDEAIGRGLPEGHAPVMDFDLVQQAQGLGNL